MLGNLRGIRESGSIFMAPTYLYIVAMIGLIGWGLVRQLHLPGPRHVRGATLVVGRRSRPPAA